MKSSRTKKFFKGVWDIITFPFRIIGKCLKYILEIIVELFTGY